MNDKEFPKARSLTNLEADEMRKAGVDPVYMSPKEREAKNPSRIRVELAKWMAEHIYKDQLPAVYPQGKLMQLADETFMLTMGKEEEVKEDLKNS